MISIALGYSRETGIRFIYIDFSKLEELNRSVFIMKQSKKYIEYMRPHIKIHAIQNYSFISREKTLFAKKYRYIGIYKDFTNEFSLLDYYFTSYDLYTEDYNELVPLITHVFRWYNHFSPIA